MSKPSLSSKIARKDLDNEEFLEGLKEMLSPSDRVAAIVGSALVEHVLLLVIHSKLENTEDLRGLFYDQGAPFGSFSNRIRSALALGCFNARTAADLNIIRDVRNQFAHALMRIDFAHPDIARVCGGLSEYEVSGEAKLNREIAPARERFERSCLQIYRALMITARTNLEARTDVLRRRLELNQLIQGSIFAGGAKHSI